MATINPTFVRVANAQQATWAALANGDDGNPLEVQDDNDHCVQFIGTFGAGGTIVWQGSNNGTNWETLTDAQGLAISKTAAALEQVVEAPRYVRPNVTGGDGTTAITCILIARRSRTLIHG